MCVRFRKFTKLEFLYGYKIYRMKNLPQKILVVRDITRKRSETNG